MSDLTASLEALLRLFAEADSKDWLDRTRLAEKFRDDLALLVAEYGPSAVDEALDELPDAALPSVALH
jgi:hypothetical protein